MNKEIIFILVLLCNFLVSSLSQIILKKSALKKRDKWYKEYLNIMVIGAYSIFVLVTLVNVYSLKFVDLSYSAILESSTYIFVPLLSFLFLKEKISKNKIIGILIITTGIIICSF